MNRLRQRSAHIVVFLLIVLSVGCGGGGYSPMNNPVPSLTSLTPTGGIAGGVAFILTVNGTGFISSSVVNFNGSAKTTTFVSSTQLTAMITAADISAAGSPSVTVTNPAPGGGTSNGLSFLIKALVSLVVTPANPTISAGGTQQFVATGTFSDSSTTDLTSSANWSTSDTTLASITSSGLASAAAIGRPQITATFNGVNGSTRLIAVEGTGGLVPRFAYSANPSDNTISVYTVDAVSSQLRANGYAQAGTGPSAIATDPAGRFAYVVNQSDNTLTAFAIDPAAGRLTAVNGSPYAAGTSPNFVAIDPSGSFAYVTNGVSGNVSGYAIDRANGSLTTIAGSPFPANAGPNCVAFDPRGRFAYVTNNVASNVMVYAIDVASGALSAIPGSPFAFPALRAVTVWTRHRRTRPPLKRSWRCTSPA